MSVYLDYAATNPIDQVVIDEMLPYLGKDFYNPSSIYSEATMVHKAIEHARALAAKLINCDVDEIIFTSGGTEADNMALKSFAWANQEKGKHIITTSIEHHAVLDSAKWLQSQGFEVTYLPVDSHCVVNVDDIKDAIRKDTILISVMWANNETGAIQPIKEIAKIAHSYGVAFHTDAVQATCTENIDCIKYGIDMMSISSHKIYGPKGCGLLYCKKGIVLTPLIHGGQQENHLRGGTESVANIVGFGKAIELVINERVNRKFFFEKLRAYLIEHLDGIENIIFNSSSLDRIPSIVNIGVKNIEAEAILILLNRAGIQVSMGSACSSESIDPSHVLTACKVDEQYIRGSIRVSFGKYSSLEDLDRFIESFESTIDILRR